MAVTASAVVDGAVALQLALARLRQLGQRPRPIFDAIAGYGEESTRLRFDKGISPTGEKWIPSMRVQAQGGQTLMKDGHLRDTITSVATAHSAEWGTNRIYGAIHQFGGVIKAKLKTLRFQIPGLGWLARHQVEIPARPYLGINEEDGKEIQRVVIEVVRKAEFSAGVA